MQERWRAFSMGPTRGRERPVRFPGRDCDWRAIRGLTYKSAGICRVVGRNASPGAMNGRTDMAGSRLLLWPVVGALLLVPFLGLLSSGAVLAAEPAVNIPPPAVDAAAPADGGLQTVVLAGGCFWGVQGVFEHTKGVTMQCRAIPAAKRRRRTTRWSAPNRPATPSRFKSHTIRKQISYGKILQIYFSVAHNPTELNYQGPDSGPSYRSAIFYRQRRAEADCRGLYRPTRSGPRLQGADRDQA